MLHLTIAAPFLLAILTIVLSRTFPRLHRGWLVLPGPLALFAYFLSRIPDVQNGITTQEAWSWIPSLGIDIVLYLDGLSLLFTLLISGIGTLVVFYSIFYMGERNAEMVPFYVYLLMFMGAMLGVVLSDNALVMYGFWELTSVASFLLIGFWHRRQKSRYGAQKAMLITVLGGLAMFGGFLMLYGMTGTFSIREWISMAGDLRQEDGIVLVMGLILLGAFTKSAQFPFHLWLPDAMEAPTPVSAYLHSATMVKAGIFLVARFSPVFSGSEFWFWAVSTTGLITLIYGSVMSLRQTDLKALLAYSTISQLGLIMGLFGLGSAAAFFTGEEALFYTAATTAGVFHLINHAIFKGTLFMVVGIIDHETDTRDVRKLGGLMRLMPVTFTMAMIGSFSMAGLPPFAGFLSKEMFFTAVLNIGQFRLTDTYALLSLFPVIAWIASVFTFVYSMILILQTFFGPYKPEELDKKPHEAPFGLLFAPAILATAALVSGAFPAILGNSLIAPAMKAIHPALLPAGESFKVSIYFWHGWTTELWMTIAVVAVGIVVYLLYSRLKLAEREWRSIYTLSFVYDGTLRLLERGSSLLTRFYMTGSMRHYLMYIFGFLIVAVGGALIYSEGVVLGMDAYAPISFFEGLSVAALVAMALAIPFARSRVTAILFVSGVGYMVTLLFVLFRAPDLALTQMIVEVVSVTLFLLCFRHLPKFRRQHAPLKVKLPKLFISVGFGVTMMIVALATLGSSPFEPISTYFMENSYKLAGGKNVVNVLLVDFRGFDTMFEICVLSVVALAIYAMIKLQLEKIGTSDFLKKELYREPPKYARSNDVLLKGVAQVTVVIIITFSLYLFMAGHNMPGGGFIGALMTASALVLLAIAFGMDFARKVLPLDFRKLTAVGLAIAFASGIGSFLFNAPFLSQAFGYFELPLLGKTELATAMMFDLGVYLTVVGVTMTIIYTIGGDE